VGVTPAGHLPSGAPKRTWQSGDRVAIDCEEEVHFDQVMPPHRAKRQTKDPSYEQRIQRALAHVASDIPESISTAAINNNVREFCCVYGMSSGASITP
jgi:hypothetical protein